MNFHWIFTKWITITREMSSKISYVEKGRCKRLIWSKACLFRCTRERDAKWSFYVRLRAMWGWNEKKGRLTDGGDVLTLAHQIPECFNIRDTQNIKIHRNQLSFRVYRRFDLSIFFRLFFTIVSIYFFFTQIFADYVKCVRDSYFSCSGNCRLFYFVFGSVTFIFNSFVLNFSSETISLWERSRTNDDGF